MNASSMRIDTLTATAVPVPPARDADAIETRALARLFWQRRWKIIGLSLLIGGAVYLGLKQVTPTYSVNAKLMLDIRKAQIVTGNQVVADVDPTQQIVNSELAILRSGVVIDTLLSRLTPAELDQLDPANRPPSAVARLRGLVGSVTGGGETAEPETDRRARLIDAVRQQTLVYSEADSYVMVVRAEAHDPVLARDLANNLSRAYLDLQLETRRRSVARATDWLEQRLDEMAAELEQAEMAVTRHRAQSLVLDGSTFDNVSQQLDDLNGEMASVRAARVEAEARLEQLSGVAADRGIAAAAQIVDTPAMQVLAEQQLQLLQNDAVWARSFGDDNARRVQIRTQLAEIELVMRAELENAVAVRKSELEVARSRERNLEQNLAALETRILSMSQGQLGLNQLERKAAAARQTYEALLVRISQARAQQELQQPDVVLIEQALTPKQPAKPRPTLMASLAVVLCAGALSAWTLFSEMAPTTFRNSRELEAATGLPVLVALPSEGWRDARRMLIQMRKDPFSRYAERIRQLRTMIALRKQDRRGHSVLIMASAPGEGKTTTALALAEMAAAAGSSVIIVDCDLRRPRVCAALGLAGQLDHDFSDFIQNRCHLGQAVYSPKGSRFDILAACKARQSVADALSVSWLGPTLRELECVYDLVIVDAPALLAVPDAMIVAREVDSSLYLVSCSDTPRGAVQRGLATLAEMGVSVRGLILNKVDPRHSLEAAEEGYGYEY